MQYYVRRIFTDPNTEITNTSDLTAAIICCDNNAGSKVFSENGDILHISDYGIIDQQKENVEKSAIVSNKSSGVYLRSSASQDGKKLIKTPLISEKITLLNSKSINGFYKVKVIKNGTTYIGYVLADRITLLE